MNRLTIALIVAMTASAAGAHSWYPAYCCKSAAENPTGDCAPIDAKYVTEGPDGYHVNLPAGSHPQLKSAAYSAVIPYDIAKVSEDEDYHICLGYNGTARFCFFAGPRGV